MQPKIVCLDIIWLNQTYISIPFNSILFNLTKDLGAFNQMVWLDQNSIFRIKCGKAYFNAEANRDSLVR